MNILGLTIELCRDNIHEFKSIFNFCIGIVVELIPMYTKKLVESSKCWKVKRKTKNCICIKNDFLIKR